MLMVFFPGHRLTPLGGFDFFPAWFDAARQLASIIWPLVIIVLGVNLSERIGWLQSSIVTVVASIPMTVLMVAVVR
jgi:predicted permease